MLRTQRARRNHRRARRGQALVELTILLPLLLVCVVGAAQLGVILYTGVSVDAAARGGALAATEYPITSGAYTYSALTGFGDGPGVTCSTANPNPTNPVCSAWSRSHASLSSLTDTLMQGNDLGSASGCPADALPDGYVTVEASATAPIFLPLIGGIFADSPGSGVRTMTSTVTMRVQPCSMTNGG